MAIPAQRLAQINNAIVAQPDVVTGQILAFGGSDNIELAYRGVVTFVLDGALTTADIYFASADGLSALPFTPSAVEVSVVGGTQQAAAYIGATVSTWTDKLATVKFSGAGTNLNTVKLLVKIWK
jgi:hypothetical protein